MGGAADGSGAGAERPSRRGFDSRRLQIDNEGHSPLRGRSSKQFVLRSVERGCQEPLPSITCNTGLGMLKDNPEVLAKAAEYVKRSRG